MREPHPIERPRADAGIADPFEKTRQGRELFVFSPEPSQRFGLEHPCLFVERAGLRPRSERAGLPPRVFVSARSIKLLSPHQSPLARPGHRCVCSHLGACAGIGASLEPLKRRSRGESQGMLLIHRAKKLKGEARLAPRERGAGLKVGKFGRIEIGAFASSPFIGCIGLRVFSGALLGGLNAHGVRLAN